MKTERPRAAAGREPPMRIAIEVEVEDATPAEVKELAEAARAALGCNLSGEEFAAKANDLLSRYRSLAQE